MAAKGRRAIAEELVELQLELEPKLLKIDELKEKLRGICEASGQAFTEEIAGKGSVEVRAGKDKELKGTVPTLKPEIYLALPKARRDALEEQGLVEIKQLWSSASKPSVTVRL
jgi:hypothetical protein